MNEFEEFLTYIGFKYIGYELDKPWSVGKGVRTYRNRIVASNGIQGGFNLSSDEEIEQGRAPVECMVDFSGNYFSDKSCVDVWRMCRGLNNVYKVKATRIDIAIDDYSEESFIPVKEMYEAWGDNNNFGFKNYKFISGGSSIDEMESTHYFGSRDSGKMTRIYRHDGRMRFETEYKRGYAPAIFQLLCVLERNWIIDGEFFNKNEVEYKLAIEELGMELNKEVFDFILQFLMNWGEIVKENHLNPAHKIEYVGLDEKEEGEYSSNQRCNEELESILQRMLAAIAIGGIDFRDKSCRKDRSKASRSDTKRLPFWQEFIDKIGSGIKLKIPRVKSNLSNSIAFVDRQVAKLLAKVKEGLGIMGFITWMDKLTERGKARFNGSDLKTIEFIKDNKRIVYLN